MPYSDLIVTPAYSVATTGLAWTASDNTGTYPESEGGYAPTGEGTATRPAENQVQKWYMWRQAPFVADEENIPSTQDGLPATIGNIDPDGVRLPDNTNQFVLMILPSAAVYATVLADAYTSGDAWTYLVEYAQTNGAVGQVDAVIAVSAANSTYDALRRFNNAQIGGAKNCDPTEYATLKAMLQGVYSNAAEAQSLTILSESQATAYAATQTVLDALNAYADNPSNQCNCDC